MNRLQLQSSRKRPNPTRETPENPLICKICLQLFTEPYSTICGHTFCRNCIVRSIQHNPQCPICETNLDLKRAKTISPNYTVASVLEQQQNQQHPVNARVMENQTGSTAADSNSAAAAALQLIERCSSLDSIRHIQEAVKRKQLELELNDQQLRNVMLHDFFDKMIEKRECAAKQIQMELELLRMDKQRVLNTLSGQLSPGSIQRLVPDSHLQQPLASSPAQSASSQAETPEHNSSNPSSHQQQQVVVSRSDVGSPVAQLSPQLAEQLSSCRRRIGRHMGSLETAYFGGGTGGGGKTTTTAVATTTAGLLRESDPQLGSVHKAELDDFSELMHRMYQYDDMKLLATLNYNLESTNSALSNSIVSSIEFDRDGEFFVIAGVTKKIKLYNYEAVVNFEGELHYPVEQLICNSKISNVSWNPYNKNMLASSDYEGTVQIWDTAVAQSTRTYKEHEKRCWTVQFNNVDPHLMASGSDDGKVKLWTLNASQSVCTIDARVNVCCVYFSPKYRNQLVFGSSDHCVHLYDIRQPNKPLNIFRGHRKAVSYVKYCNENEVISASTDSNLRLWDVNSGKCLQTMRGHQNEKNFVGLATDGKHVVCGSENNRLYLYYKQVPDPLLSFDCAHHSVDSPPMTTAAAADGTSGESTSTPTQFVHQPAPPNGEFVSAVCWKRNSNVILAANSQGQTFVLELQ